MLNKKKALYRKVNTRTHGVRHKTGGDYKHSRNKTIPPGMKQGIKRGLDYTPLFKFLLSKIGENWNTIHSEAIARLDKEEPIYWIVAKHSDDAQAYVRVGENSYYSGLFINEQNILQITAPEITADTLKPSCACCTHTFNGIPFTQKFQCE